MEPTRFGGSIRPADADWGRLFGEGSGSTVGASYGTKGGTLSNGIDWLTNTPFVYDGNYSTRLDGSNDFVEMSGLDGAINVAIVFSLSMWIRSDATDQDRTFWNAFAPSGSDTLGGRYDLAGWLNGNGGPAT